MLRRVWDAVTPCAVTKQERHQLLRRDGTEERERNSVRQNDLPPLCEIGHTYGGSSPQKVRCADASSFTGAPLAVHRATALKPDALHTFRKCWRTRCR